MNQNDKNKVEEPTDIYEEINKSQFVSDEVPHIITQLIEKATIEINEGKFSNHEDVMNRFKEKYNFLK